MGMNCFALNCCTRQKFDSSGILCLQPNLIHDSNISLQGKQSDCLLSQAVYSGHAVLVGNFVYAIEVVFTRRRIVNTLCSSTTIEMKQGVTSQE